MVDVWRMIDGGGLTLCGITADERVYCWGASQGIDGGVVTPLPGPVLDPVDAITLSVGAGHTCAVRTDGRATCWGWNLSGQLGDGTRSSRPRPGLVASTARFEDISAGEGHTCGVLASGAAWCWGGNRNGQLGDGTQTLREEPRQVVGGLSFRSVSAGRDHTCALTTDGRAYCWGVNGSGESHLVGNAARSGCVASARPTTCVPAAEVAVRA